MEIIKCSVLPKGFGLLSSRWAVKAQHSHGLTRAARLPKGWERSIASLCSRGDVANCWMLIRRIARFSARWKALESGSDAT